MKSPGLAIAALGIATLSAAGVVYAQSANERISFPEGFEDGVHYGTAPRGSIVQELYTSEEAIEAARKGEDFPDGTVITLVDRRGGEVHRYVVMEKRTGWGDLMPEEARAGDWLFREFAPDGTPNMSEDGVRCASCHQSQASQDFVFTVDQMRNAD